MNDTGATSQSGASLLPDGIGALTTLHLVIVALLAIGALAVIVVGMRRARIRRQAERQVERHAQEAGVPAAEVTAPTPAAPPSPPPIPSAAAPPAPTPVPGPPPTDAAPLADEPIAAAAPLDASPASEAAPAPVAATASAADGSVTQLKGLGPKVSAKLAELGVTTVGQLAALDDAGAAALDAELGPFRGRMMRDRWIEQARFLAAGDRAGFEAVFGRL